MSRLPDVNPSVTFKTVFEAEIQQIKAARENRHICGGQGENWVKGSLIGLAFSGGGIRSATFNLGFLQALAKNKLLHKFDYLSTVSGGGYIGGWLAALTKRFLDEKKKAKENSDFCEFEATLIPEAYKPDRRRERSFLHWLRMYSNYLTPNKSLLSGDTWTMVGTWARNAFLNQTILILLFAGVLLLCQGLLSSLLEVSQGHPRVLLIVGGAAWFLGAIFVIVNMTERVSDEQIEGASSRAMNVMFEVILPFSIACLFLNFALPWKDLNTSSELWWLWPVAGAAFYFFAWVIAWALCVMAPKLRPRVLDNSMLSFLAFSISSVVAGAVGGGLVWAYRQLLCQIPSCQPFLNGASSTGSADWILAVLGPAVLMLIVIISGSLHLGIAGLGCKDFLREWWARLGGYMLLLMLGGIPSTSEPISDSSVCSTPGDRTSSIILMSITSFPPAAWPSTGRSGSIPRADSSSLSTH